MSLASTYAVQVQAAKDTMAAVQPPPPFHCPTCDGSVDLDGTCDITPGTGSGAVMLSQADALKLRDWITTTFGGL